MEAEGSVDWTGTAAAAVLETTPVEPPASSVRSHHELSEAPCDTVDILVADACNRGRTNFLGGDHVIDGLICTPSGPQLDRAKPPNATLPMHEHMNKGCISDRQCGLALGEEPDAILAAEGTSSRAGSTAPLEAPVRIADDCNSRMRQHLDKAYRIVNHLSESAELMQKLHCTSAGSADALDGNTCVEATQNREFSSHRLGSTDVHSQAMEPMRADQPASSSATTSCQAFCASFDATACHVKTCVTTDRSHCTSSSPQHLAHAATCSGTGTPELPGYLSWQPTCTVKPEIRRSCSLNSSATRMPRKIRPSDAIVNRVDEIHRSVERLRQAHLSAARSYDSMSAGHAN